MDKLFASFLIGSIFLTGCSNKEIGNTMAPSMTTTQPDTAVTKTQTGDLVILREDEALRLGKQIDTSEAGKTAEWKAELVNEKIEGTNNPSWKVTAIYPFGSKQVVYLDAVTGKQIVLSEIEAPGIEERLLKMKNPLILESDFLAVASQGKLKGVEFGLGTSKQDLLDKWGKPDETGSFHAEFWRYGDVSFYIWEDGRVHVIDVKIGLPADRVKELLGKPEFEGRDTDVVDAYYINYMTSPNVLYFQYESMDANAGFVRFKNAKGE